MRTSSSSANWSPACARLTNSRSASALPDARRTEPETPGLGALASIFGTFAMKIRLHRLRSVSYLALSPFYHVRATPARRDRRQNRPGRTERTSLTLDLSGESQRDPSLRFDFVNRRKPERSLAHVIRSGRRSWSDRRFSQGAGDILLARTISL